jgi:hypothetical protein
MQQRTARRRPRIHLAAHLFVVASALTACGSYEPRTTLTRSDVPDATRDPVKVAELGHPVPCRAITDVEDALVERNDGTESGGEAVRIKARKDITVDSSVWPSDDPDGVLRDLAAAVGSCRKSQTGGTYSAVSGPHGSIGYHAVVDSSPYSGRLERLFQVVGGNVVVVGIDDPQNADTARARDLVGAARSAAQKATQKEPEPASATRE